MKREIKDASIPGQFPSQDGIDRSDHIAVAMSISIDSAEMMSGVFDWQLLRTLRPDYESWIKEAIEEAEQESQAAFQIDDVQTTHYQVGPAAGGIIDNIQQITTIVANASDVVTVVTAGIWIRSIMAKVKSKAQSWASEQPVDTMAVHAAYTPLVLKHMGIGYLADFLGVVATKEVIIECLTAEFFDGYSSPAHPTASVEYLIIIPVDSDTYLFRVFGDSSIQYLKRRTASGEEVVPTLKYLDDTFEQEAPNTNPDHPQ